MGDRVETRLAEILGRAVWRRRRELGMGQRELAEAIGSSQAHVSRIEHGLGNPTLQTIQRLEDVLGIRLVALGEPGSNLEREKVGG